MPGSRCPDGAEGEQCREGASDDLDGASDATPRDTSSCKEPCGDGARCIDGECVPDDQCERAGCQCDFEGTQTGVCSEGELNATGTCTAPSNYEEDESTCDEKDNDCDGDVDESCKCDYNGVSTGVCSDGVPTDDGGCKTPPDFEEPEASCDGVDNDCDGETDEGDPNAPLDCAPGERETRECGKCGEKVRECQSDCTWGAWSDCRDEGVCSPGAMESRDCGNCGEQSRSCGQDCSWESWSTCSGEGVCSPGATDPTGCPDCLAKECTNNCTWTSDCTTCTCQGTQMCGSSCQDGYHTASVSCDPTCSGDCSPSNSRFCEPNCGSSFTSCESTCPDGYSLARTACDTSCAGDCSNGDNAIECTRN